MTVEGEMHSGPLNPSCIIQGVPIPENYKIVEFKGRGGDIIDQLSIKLNNGITYIFGGHGGNPWSIDIPEGKNVIAIAGGHGGHIHNLAVYF